MSAPLVERTTRYLPGAGQITTAYALTVPAHQSYNNAAAIAAVNANLFIAEMGSLGEASGGRRMRGIRVRPFGRGADNDTYSSRIYAVHFTGEPGQGDQGPLELHLLATVDVTLGNAVGAVTNGTTLLTSSDRIADTVTLTKSAYLTALESAMSLSTGAGAHSPADNTQATFWIPECGNADAILIDTDLGTATAANFLIQKDI